MSNEGTTMAGKTPEELKELGNEAYASHDYVKAIEYYSKAIQLDKSNHVFFSNRSASYMGMSDWTKAAEDAKECIRLDPTFIKGYYRLATAQIEQKDYGGAYSTVRQGLSIDPNNSQLLKQMRNIRQLRKNSAVVVTGGGSAAAAAAATSPAAGTSAAKQQKQQPAASLQDQFLDAVLSGGMDDATTKELQELQEQYRQSNRESQTVQANVMKIQRENKVYELTQEEVKKLASDDTRCYRSVGKVFLISNKKSSLVFLDKTIEENNKKEHDLNSKLEYLERRKHSQQQNMQELLNQHTTTTATAAS